jgi:hypothetical protein
VPGSFSSATGHAYLALAAALAAQGKSNETRAAAHLAAEQLQSTVGPDALDTRSAYQLAGLDAQYK